MDLRVRDVWSSDIPLVGAYSRFGWNHPGPAMYWLVAPVSLIAGKAAWGTLVGCALLQGVGIGLTAYLGRRAGGLMLMLGALAIQALSYVATGSWILVQPWNPHVAFPFLVPFVLSVWLTGLGDVRVLPVAVLVGTFLVQTHVGYAPLVAMGFVWIVAAAWLEVRRDHSRAAEWRGRPLSWALALGVIAWLPPIVEQVTKGRNGNLARLAGYFLLGHGEGGAIGLRRGAGIFAVEFQLPPPWLGGNSPVDLLRQARPVSLGWLLLPVVLGVIGVVAARASGNRKALHAVVLTSALSVVGVFTLGRVRGSVENYLFYWRIPLAVMFVASVVASVVAWTRIAERWRTATTAALFVLVAVPSVAFARDVADTGNEPFAETAGAMIHSIRGDAPRHSPILVRHVGSTLRGLEGAIVDDLDRHGTRVQVDRRLDYQFGDHRAKGDRGASNVWYVVEDGVYTSLMTNLPHARALATATPLGRADEAEIRALQRQLAGNLQRAGRDDLLTRLDSPLVAFALANVHGIDHAAVDRLGKLNEVVERTERCRCSVIAFPIANLPNVPYQPPATEPPPSR